LKQGAARNAVAGLGESTVIHCRFIDSIASDGHLFGEWPLNDRRGKKSYSPNKNMKQQLSLQSLTIKVNNLPLLLLLLLRQIQCTCCDFGCFGHSWLRDNSNVFCCRPFEMIAYLSLCLLLAASPPLFQAKSISNHGNHF
jgi:hypothetical protein